MILDNEYNALKNVPLRAKQFFYEIDKNPTDYAMTCNRSTPYAVNTMKNINLNYNFLYELYTTFYNEISDIFEYLFRI